MARRFESTTNRWAGGAIASVAVGAMIFTAGLQPPAAAQTDTLGRVCSDMTLNGEYGLVGSGQRAVPPFRGGGIEKFVATAMTTFDGHGGFAIQGTGAGLHGEVVGVDPSNDNLILGTYSVNENCTGTIQWQPPAPIPPIVHSFVIVDNGRQIRSAVMSPLPNVSIVEFVRK